SRPSGALAATTLAVVGVGVLFPFLPVGKEFGFTPLPGVYFVFLAVATATYLLLVEAAKRLLMPKLEEEN
ncbi:MAG: hypothetical protein ACM3SW_00210, partial [Actinomycetota bacterium]